MRTFKVSLSFSRAMVWSVTSGSRFFTVGSCVHCHLNDSPARQTAKDSARSAGTGSWTNIGSWNGPDEGLRQWPVRGDLKATSEIDRCTEARERTFRRKPHGQRASS